MQISFRVPIIHPYLLALTKKALDLSIECLVSRLDALVYLLRIEPKIVVRILVEIPERCEP